MPFLKRGGPDESKAMGESSLLLSSTKEHQTMTKSLEVISETVRDPKHPFRKVDNQPKKPLKHRYERRKIKGYLHLSDWTNDWTASEATI
jgi:hypothetical protein